MTFRVEVDWDKDDFGSGFGSSYGSGTYGSGSYGGGGSGSTGSDDVTARVRTRQSAMSLSYGRDQSTALAPAVAGRGSFVLDNSSRDYSPRNTASPLYGSLKPARPVRISRTVGGLPLPFVLDASAILEDSVDCILFIGHTDDNPINPDINDKTVTLSLVDSLADFRGLNISTPLYSGVRTGTVIGYILDAAGWPAELRDLDPGATVIPWWWEDNTDALTALEKVLQAEGPPALLTIGADGAIEFKDRHHRLLDAPSVTSQATWAGAGNPEPIMNLPFSYDDAWRNIVNTGTVEIGVRQGHDPEAIWTSDATITLAAGEQRSITASTTDPFFNAETPVAGTDYTVVSGSPTVALAAVNGSSATIRITAGGGIPAIIEGLQLRAQPVTVSYSVQVSVSLDRSIEDYGSRSFPNDLSWCNQYDAEAVLQTAIAQRANPNPVLNVRFLVGDNLARASAVLTRDLSDRVKIVESETALNDDFFIESIQHDLTSEFDHSVTFGLEMVPVVAAAPVDTSFHFGDADRGFDEGTFSSGLIPTENLLRFDDATVGFDEGGCAA